MPQGYGISYRMRRELVLKNRDFKSSFIWVLGMSLFYEAQFTLLLPVGLGVLLLFIMLSLNTIIDTYEFELLNM